MSTRTPAKPAKAKAKAPAPANPPQAVVTRVNSRYLETLVGYNARRAALVIIGEFLPRMAPYDLRPVDFSMLSLVVHNPGITSRQLCDALDMQAPNLVGMVSTMEKRGLISRRPHPNDGRAMGLHTTEAGLALMRAAEKTAAELEHDMTARLSAQERKTLIQLLQKVYK
jgi:DNA-binding MarR family transcriptional regulator